MSNINVDDVIEEEVVLSFEEKTEEKSAPAERILYPIEESAGDLSV